MGRRHTCTMICFSITLKRIAGSSQRSPTLLPRAALTRRWQSLKVEASCGCLEESLHRQTGNNSTTTGTFGCCTLLPIPGRISKHLVVHRVAVATGWPSAGDSYWSLEVSMRAPGIAPSPRSACQMTPTPDGSGIIIYGGYSKLRLKKDIEKGTIHSDMFLLKQEGKSGQEKWTWSRLSPTGNKPPPRSGFCMAVGPAGRAVLFGGVYDEEEEETLEGDFYNDLYLFDTIKNRWYPSQLRGNKTDKKKRRRGKKDEAGEEVTDEKEESASTGPTEVIKEIVTEDGTVMTIKEVIPGAQEAEETNEGDEEEEDASALVEPCPRSSAMATVRQGKLFLYGGMFEVGSRQFTLNDFYCLDLHKMDQWEVLVEMDPKTQEWLEESESEDSDEEEEAEGGAEGGEEEEKESDKEDEDEHPAAKAGETLTEYQARTEQYWMGLAHANMGADAKDKKVAKVALAMAKVFFEENTEDA
ncbi:kelch domain-containing protein 4 isoform X2 [Syngnathoides biaculeatus]|uniref:kelch domain-containing protein 4 isoform X2 n=1 Tax=Syngnathoides biaculeatus TaxID=300417 RepID=UPI002ADDF4F3|nr:kelch domain-containing protein 4 isoform X2 [Syngnathoides biaculeatus]